MKQPVHISQPLRDLMEMMEKTCRKTAEEINQESFR